MLMMMMMTMTMTMAMAMAMMMMMMTTMMTTTTMVVMRMMVMMMMTTVMMIHDDDDDDDDGDDDDGDDDDDVGGLDDDDDGGGGDDDGWVDVFYWRCCDDGAGKRWLWQNMLVTTFWEKPSAGEFGHGGVCPDGVCPDGVCPLAVSKKRFFWAKSAHLSIPNLRQRRCETLLLALYAGLINKPWFINPGLTLLMLVFPKMLIGTQPDGSEWTFLDLEKLH